MNNMKFIKKTLSLFLVMAMTMTILALTGPLSAYAEMGTENASAQAGVEETAAAEAAQGTEPGETADNASSSEDGAEAVSAEETGEEASSKQKELPEITEDGHIDGERLKQWVENYLKTDHWDEPQCSMSIGLWYSGTDETWFYNPDEWMYGVNWSKLPISMVFAEKLANGELSGDSVITGIQLEYALQTVLENSSGPSFYSMVTYLGGNTVSNCAELVPQYAGLPEDYYTDEFYQQSYYTARIMTEVTKTLYQGGDERFPNVLKYMRESQPWDMFNRNDWIRTVLHTSQTHAAAWGNGAGDYLHCTGVIYTPTPIVLTIMMKNISDLDIMGGVADHMSVLAVALDAKQKELRLAEETAADQQVAMDAESKDLPNASSGTAPDSGAQKSELPDVSTSQTPANSSLTATQPENAAGTDTAGVNSSTPDPAPEEAYSPMPRILLLAATTLILLLLILIAALRRNRKKPR